jgi:hypothetical protein
MSHPRYSSSTDGGGAGAPPPGGYVKLLLERFPHVRDISLQLLLQQETFRELCEEYEACTQAAERLAQTESNEALRKEYSALRLRLEGELLRYISEHMRSHSPG